MRKIVIAAALMWMPVLAWAELDYNSVSASSASTSYRNGDLDLKELGVGLSYSVGKDTYLQVAATSGQQNTLWSYGDRAVRTLRLGAGYHRPLMPDTDAIAEGHVVLGTASWAGASTSANGYDVGVGIRTLIFPSLEAALAMVQAHTSNGSFSSTDLFPRAEFGYALFQQVQMTLGIDFRPDQTMRIGLRYLY